MIWEGCTPAAAAIQVIPACAGNSRDRGLRRRDAPGHPCVCGEQIMPAHSLPIVVGSSLRVRGTAMTKPPPSRAHSGHPCVCGEQFEPIRVNPLVVRVIPACAGNRASACTPAPDPPGHPCVCGEQLDLNIESLISNGSSLRVRGTGPHDRNRAALMRVIPACAGNSAGGDARPHLYAGHPCVCGEQVTDPSSFTDRSGSSLRVRGTGLVTALVRELKRVIPACAGNRLSELARNLA